LGYIYVEEVLRGQHIASNLVERAMREAGNVGVFATTRTDNAAMQKILCRNGFVLAGNPYLSNDGQRNLSLFVHPAGAS
jgi:predicted GNAT family N-acyltransferase